MPHGYNGRILRIDLSSGKLATEELPENFYRQYFGGEGFVGYFLLKELPSDVEPLSPANKLIFAAGPLTGVPVGGCGRHSVGGKSPLTGGYGEADQTRHAALCETAVDMVQERPGHQMVCPSG